VTSEGRTQTGSASLRIASANPSTSVDLQYTLASRARVSLRIYDVQGRLVRTLVDQDAAPGSFRARWDGFTDAGTSAGRGVFFARMTADGAVMDSKKVVIE
jgi:flagellar hook assembly protein FlgD